jgi:DNA repair exonuclease SbcCD nuclease subunit
MKFLHAADIHLDSPLKGLSRRAVVPEEVLRDCTRRAFANLVDLAITEDVAFLLIAGDLFDGDWKDFSSGLFLAREMARLGRPCIAIRGNHDAQSVVTKHLLPPRDLKILSSRTAETVRLDEWGVAVHGRSFPDRAVPEDFSADYPQPVPGMLNIGLLHTSAEGSAEHETYAPCRIEALVNKGYDYWALGHVHGRAVLHEHPWIVFPGNLQGRSARETGAKGATLVEVRDGAIAGVAHRPLDVLRWGHAVADVSGAESLGECLPRLRLALQEAADQRHGRPLLARLTLRGATPCHAHLAGEAVMLDAQCRAVAAEMDELYLERVMLETRAPEAADRTALAELEAAFAESLEDPDVARGLLEDFRRLRDAVPHGARPALPESEAALRALLPDAWAMVAQALA